MNSFTQDLGGRKLSFYSGFSLGFKPASLQLIFKAQTSPLFDSSHPPGAFVRELWRKDVVEIFFAEPESSRYQEFNLSPGGAWWSAVFSDYRELESECFSKQVTCVGMVSEEQWIAGIEIPFSAIRLSCEVPRALVNVSAILGQSPRSYLSWAKLGGVEPDFHRSWEYLPLRELDPI